MSLHGVQTQMKRGWSPNNEESAGWVLYKVQEGSVIGFQKRLDLSRRTISMTYPNYFGREAAQETKLLEIRVFGNDDIVLSTGQFPNTLIRRFIQTDFLDMAGTRKQLG